MSRLIEPLYDARAYRLSRGQQPQVGLAFHIVRQIVERFLHEFDRRLARFNVPPGVFAGSTIEFIQTDAGNSVANILRNFINRA